MNVKSIEKSGWIWMPKVKKEFLLLQTLSWFRIITLSIAIFSSFITGFHFLFLLNLI